MDWNRLLMHRKRLLEEISSIQEKGLYRKRRVLSDLHLLDFGSNDYLGFATSDTLKKAFKTAYETLPHGSGGSMSLSGYHRAHEMLEKKFAELLEADDALLFSSGYTANLSVMALLASMEAQVFFDKGIHASIYDGARLNGLSFKRFLNEETLFIQETEKERAVVLTEGIFSQDGRCSDLKTLAHLCRDNIPLLVDEAHSFGVLGPNGLGAVFENGLTQKEVPLRMIGFGKALGCQGGVVVGDALWIDALFQTARANRYSTAMSPALASGLLASLIKLSSANAYRESLFQNIDYFRTSILNSSFSFSDSKTHIQYLTLGSPELALEYEALLFNKNILCHALRPPTVSSSKTGLRIVLKANHKLSDIDNLLESLHEIRDILE